MAARSDDGETVEYRALDTRLRAPLSAYVTREAEDRVVIPKRNPSDVCLVLEMADAVNALIRSASEAGQSEPTASELADGLQAAYPDLYARAIKQAH